MDIAPSRKSPRRHPPYRKLVFLRRYNVPMDNSTLSSIWRYPVKSMAGEELDEVEVTLSASVVAGGPISYRRL
jgi:hypothetical protein